MEQKLLEFGSNNGGGGGNGGGGSFIWFCYERGNSNLVIELKLGLRPVHNGQAAMGSLAMR